MAKNKPTAPEVQDALLDESREEAVDEAKLAEPAEDERVALDEAVEPRLEAIDGDEQEQRIVIDYVITHADGTTSAMSRDDYLTYALAPGDVATNIRAGN
jgi:hypothetical protein